MMGSSIHLHVSVSSQDVIVIIPTMELKDYAKNSAYGTTIKLKFTGEMVHLFNKDNGNNLIKI